MSVEVNKALARRFLEATARADLAAIDEMMAPDFVDRSLMSGQEPDREGYKRSAAETSAPFSHQRVTIEDQIAEGDKVVSRWTARGTHHGELLGIAPTGNGVTIKGIDVLRVAEGRIVERWAQFNDLEMMQQLGVVPPPVQSEEASPT